MKSSEIESSDDPQKRNQYSLFDERADLEALSYDLFFKEGPFAIIILDKFFQISKVNDRIKSFFGKDNSQMMGRSIFTFLHSEDAIKLKHTFQNRHHGQSPLLLKLGFIKNMGQPIPVDTFVKKFCNSFGESNYGLLMFDKEFCPDSDWLSHNHEIYQAIIDTQEQERQRIGQQLHDSVAQLLYAIRLNIQHLVIKNKELNHDIIPLKRLLNDAIHQVRHISVDLVPAVLHDFGLKTAIITMAERFSTIDFKITCQIPDQVNQLDREIQLVIYRIVQELLNNSMKHTDGTEIKVSITPYQEEIQVIVMDNGTGFKDDPKESFDKGTGLKTIKNMAELYKGEMNINSSSSGTSIQIVLRTK